MEISYNNESGKHAQILNYTTKPLTKLQAAPNLVIHVYLKG